jgi:GntR family transcriptional regulator/MocR family aminotransferase
MRLYGTKVVWFVGPLAKFSPDQFIRRMKSQPVTWLVLDRNAGDLEGQLCRAIRERILRGRLAAGERLPSSRSLALALRISRSTVVQAYEQLRAEGFIEAARGSATRVAALQELPHPPAATQPHPWRRAQDPIEPERSLPFRPGIPDLAAFPTRAWSRCLSARTRSLRIHDLGYGAAAGLPELRAAILAHVASTRGVVAHADQVVILPSAGLIIEMLARLSIAPQAHVAWIEEPGYSKAQTLLRHAGAHLVPIPCDDAGIDVARGFGPPPRLIYVTPSHQYPTGAAMSLSRRLALLEFAQAHGATVLEDDYDSEFHYATRPIAALQGIDRAQCVAYIGTLSKVLAPGVRVAYAILPPGLLPKAEAYLRFRGGTVPIHVQAALADFINEGHLRAHIRRMRGLYAERMACTINALHEYCGPFLQVAKGEGGLQLAAWFRDHTVDDRAITTELHRRGIGAQALSDFYLGPPRSGLSFGIARSTARGANAMAATLSRIMHEVMPSRRLGGVRRSQGKQLSARLAFPSRGESEA